MKKSELIKKVEVSTKCEGQVVEMIIDSLLEEITAALKTESMYHCTALVNFLQENTV